MADIREAILSDYSSINWLSHSLGYDVISDEAARTNLQYMLSSSSDQVWVCEQDGHMLGWIHVFIAHRIASPKFVEIGGIAVNSENYGQGIGRDLVYHAKLWTETHKLKLRVRSDSTREGALKFYAAVGFKNLKNQQVLEYQHLGYED